MIYYFTFNNVNWICFFIGTTDSLFSINDLSIFFFQGKMYLNGWFFNDLLPKQLTLKNPFQNKLPFFHLSHIPTLYSLKCKLVLFSCWNKQNQTIFKMINSKLVQIQNPSSLFEQNTRRVREQKREAFLLSKDRMAGFKENCQNWTHVNLLQKANQIRAEQHWFRKYKIQMNDITKDDRKT